jgi:hypothetical protein
MSRQRERWPAGIWAAVGLAVQAVVALSRVLLHRGRGSGVPNGGGPAEPWHPFE